MNIVIPMLCIYMLAGLAIASNNLKNLCALVISQGLLIALLNWFKPNEEPIKTNVGMYLSFFVWTATTMSFSDNLPEKALIVLWCWFMYYSYKLGKFNEKKTLQQ